MVVAVVLDAGWALTASEGPGLCSSSRDNAAREATAALRRRERSLKEGAQTCVLGRRQNVVVAMPHIVARFSKGSSLLGPGAGSAAASSSFQVHDGGHCDLKGVLRAAECVDGRHRCRSRRALICKEGAGA